RFQGSGSAALFRNAAGPRRRRTEALPHTMECGNRGEAVSRPLQGIIGRKMIHVCSLSRMHDVVATTGAEHVVTLIRDTSRVTPPKHILEENHLSLSIDDIEDELEGMVAPGEGHVAELLAFVKRWKQDKPIVVHCFAGISRSSAAAFITACAVFPERDELEI